MTKGFNTVLPKNALLNNELQLMSLKRIGDDGIALQVLAPRLGEYHIFAWISKDEGLVIQDMAHHLLQGGRGVDEDK